MGGAHLLFRSPNRDAKAARIGNNDKAKQFNLNSLSMAAIVELCGKAGIQTVASLK